MSSAKEIRTKIKSIKSTQKITRAMEMVAASKMRKAQMRMRASRPYAERIRDMINHMAKGRLEFNHSYMIERPVKNIGILVVSTDRGLCGGLNAQLFKTVLTEMMSWEDKAQSIKVASIGRKAELFFSKMGAEVVASLAHIGDEPTMQSLIGPIKVLLDAYEAEEIDRIYIAYNEFVNTMSQTPKCELLVPVLDEQPDKTVTYWDYIYEPSAEELLNAIMVRYVESMVYQSVVENVACEQAARMVAMKSASDNAGDLIDEFQLIYNKARQASITQELSEIVAGAAAV